MAIRTAQRRGTAAHWTTVNPILFDGEIGLETDTKQFKFGDGVTAWNSLPYFIRQEVFSGHGAPAITPAVSAAVYFDVDTGTEYKWYSSSWH